MGKHRKSSKKWSPYVTAGVAVEAAVLLGFAYATDSNVVPASLLADSSIFVDGTKSILGNEQGNPPFRMADAFQGQYAQADPDQNEFIFYPRSFGPATGLGDPTYDESEGEATGEIVQAVIDAQNDPDYQDGDTIYVVGYSQGAGAASKAMAELEAQGVDTENVEFVLAANPRRNDGGLLARLPKGVYLPVFGVTFGDGTSPQNEDTHVLQVTKMYDGVGDSPSYLFNGVSNLNAFMGYYYLHPDYYKDVDPNDPSAIVSTSADGRITDVLIPAPDGQLPLTKPLLQLGVPQNVVSALDPFLRRVIETGYNRPTGEGTYPSEPVPFQLVPPPERWLSDVQSVAAGGALTLQRLAQLGQPSTPVTTNRSGNDAPAVAAAAPVAPAVPDADVTDSDGQDATGTPLEKPVTGTGPNLVKPPKQPKNGWKPGDLLRSIFGPKPTAGAPSSTEGTNATPPAAEPTPDTGDPAAAPNASSEG